MSRYFYTDPLSAGWMAKHFGMRFNQYNLDDSFLGEAHIESYTNHILRSPSCWEESYKQFYIHPDSLHLLEPQMGDYGSDDDGHPLHFHHGVWHYGIKHCTKDFRNITIIQRNGIPFIWPESG